MAPSYTFAMRQTNVISAAKRMETNLITLAGAGCVHCVNNSMDVQMPAKIKWKIK